MSVQHLTIDDTRTWFQASDRQVFIGDVLDLATSATTRVRFARYGRGAVHEWMVTVDETLIVTATVLVLVFASGHRDFVATGAGQGIPAFRFGCGFQRSFVRVWS